MNTNKRIILILLIIILIVLILLFLAIRNIGYIGLVPTGNVDIFNIECDKNDNICDNSNDNDSNNSTNSKDVFNENEEVITVLDNDKTWDSINKLRIFTNPAYEFKNIIAPGSRNAYQFVINNNNSSDIKYDLTFIENNEFNINLKYKLKRNGKYIANKDNWVSYSDISASELVLKAKDRDVYTLEWFWIDSEEDTMIGFEDANYSLKINIKATSNIGL